MKIQKITAVLFVSGILSVSCGEQVELGEPVYLFGQITENEIIYGLNYQVCDGEQTISYKIPYEIAEEANREILRKLHAVEARPVIGSERPEAEFPLYSVFAQDDEHEVPENAAFTWSDGYLYDSDGTVYAFDFDFESLIEEYGMTYREEYDVWDGVSATALYYIAQDEDGWKKEWLSPVTDRVISEEITLNGGIFDDGILSFSLTNSGERTMYTEGVEYSLHVKLDGIWYSVPSLPGTVIWSFYPEIPAGETYEEECWIGNRYGDLPAGMYRVKIDVWGENEERAEQKAVYCEFTLE